jgi:hypothetical protein
MRIARGISVTNTSRPISTAPAYDADATAFFTAASITDTTQKSAVNTLVLSLKSANIWSKFKSIYPVVGGSASSHKWNLKDPRDLDLAFRLTFSTGWTHSSTGMLPSTAYADTKLAPSISLSTNNTHISIYSRDNNESSAALIGSNDGTPTFAKGLFILPKNSNLFYGAVNQNTSSNLANTDAKGFFLVKRTTSTGIVMQKNSTQNSITVTSSGLTANNTFLGAINTGIYYYASNQISFASIGDGLTDAEALSFYNAVQTYQTTLGRQV